MNRIIVFLVGLALLLCPIIAAVPEDQMWSLALASAALTGGALAAFNSRKDMLPPLVRRSAQFMAALLLWAIVSVIATALLSASHVAFLQPKLRGLTTLFAYVAGFCACSVVASRNRSQGIALIGCVVAGAAIAAVIGLQEYLTHVRAGEGEWRVFGTSTPDYLAAYMLLVFPVTIGLAMSVNERMLKGLLFLVGSLQFLTIFPTGSRFAIVSLAVEAVTVLLLALAAKRGRANVESNGVAASPTVLTRPRLPVVAGIGAVVLVGLLVIGKPVVKRLSHNQANSGQFRILTWQGSIDLALSKPIFGSGIGTWQYAYQPFARAGFTRVAHNSYLQFADDTGLPGFILLLTALSVFGTTGWLAYKKEASTPSGGSHDAAASQESAEPPALVADNRRLLGGLLVGTVGLTIQNVIDSDWYVFAIGFSAAALAGVMIGLSAAPQESGTETKASGKQSPVLVVSAVAACAAAVFGAFCSLGAFNATVGSQSLVNGRDDSGASAAAYQTAISLLPLDGHVLGEYGYRLQGVAHQDAQSAVASLQKAIELQPDSTNFRRLGDVYAMSGQTQLAIDTYKRGLAAEPYSVDLLLDLAKISPQTESLAYYARLYRVEKSPVGQVRALGDITEARFAIADTALAEDAMKTKDLASATKYYEDARTLLEQYASEGGSTNTQHQALSGGHSDPQADRQYSIIYAHVMDSLIPLLTAEKQGDARARAGIIKTQYAIITGDAFRSVGIPSEAQKSYAEASEHLSEAQRAVMALPLERQARYTNRLESLTKAIANRTAPQPGS